MTPNKDSMTNYDTIIERLDKMKTTRSYKIEKGMRILDPGYGEFRRWDEGYNHAIDQAIAIIKQVKDENKQTSYHRDDTGDNSYQSRT